MEGMSSKTRHGTVKTLRNHMTPAVQQDQIDFREVVDLNDQDVRNSLRRMKDRHAKFEYSMSFSQCFCKFWRSVASSMLYSFACIMEGNGLVMVTGFFSVPAFKRDFDCIGDKNNIEYCEVAVGWQTGMIMLIYGGQLFGLFIQGYLSEGAGYKKTMNFASLLMCAFIFVPVFANSWTVFIIGQFLCGIPWGIYQTLASSYASDVCPIPIKGYVTSSLGLCWIIGQMIGAIIQYLCLNIRSNLAYKLPLILQWVWLVPIFALLWLTPESPWWLVRRGRYADARSALKSLSSKNAGEYSVDDHLAYIIWNNAEEISRSTNGGKTGYLECFRDSIDRRRTFIANIIWSIQNASGAVLLSFSSYFFKQAGLPTSLAFQLTIVQYASGIISNCVGWWLMKRYYRRTIHIGGLIGIFLCLLSIGTVGVLDRNGTTSKMLAGYLVGAVLILMSCIFSATISLITYPIVTEIPSTRHKTKTVNLARSSYVLVGMFNAGIQPQLLNPQAGGLGAMSGFIYAVAALLSAIYSYFFLPETKDFNFDVIDKIFEAKVTARSFRKKGCEMKGTRERPSNDAEGKVLRTRSDTEGSKNSEAVMTSPSPLQTLA